MSTRQLGPEQPKPLAVLSEDHLRSRLVLPYIPEHELLTFGKEYEDKICALIDSYLHLDTCDQVCYVGEQVGSVAPLIQEKFCILPPITCVEPGTVHYEESSTSHIRVPIKVPHVGVEQFFADGASPKGAGAMQFDKVIFLDTLSHVTDCKQFFRNVMMNTTELSKLLIIHRAVPFNSLPMFSRALNRLKQYEQSHLHVIDQLKSLGLEVIWEIESIPIVTNKWKWYAMIKNRFPPELEIVSDYEIMEGLRELSEGLLKYSDSLMEFTDRLLFITVQRPIQRYPLLGRRAGPKPALPVRGLRYEMPVSDDIASMVEAKARVQEKREKKKVFQR